MHERAEWSARADLEDLVRMSRGWRRMLASRRRTLDAIRRGKRAAQETCALYLQAEEDERESMREYFRLAFITLPDGRTGIQPLLHWVLSEDLRRLRSTGDEDDLRLGLAAVSLEDNQFDGRTTLTRLGDLWVAALKHGLSPRPVFESVAALSSESTGELIGRFEETAHFRNDLAPKLAELAEPS